MYVSNCCKASVENVGDNSEGTRSYVCTACRKACDAIDTSSTKNLYTTAKTVAKVLSTENGYIEYLNLNGITSEDAKFDWIVNKVNELIEKHNEKRTPPLQNN